MQAREAKYMMVVQWVQEQIENGSIGMGAELMQAAVPGEEVRKNILI